MNIDDLTGARAQRLPPSDWLSLPDLAAECWDHDRRGIRVHELQSVRCVNAVLEAAASGTLPWAPASGKTTIVLAVDGLSYHYATSELDPDFLAPLTSMFPSTSSVSWLSSLTGLGAPGHMVPSVAYRWQRSNEVFYVYSHELLTWDTVRPAGDEVTVGPWPTVFSRLSRKGLKSATLVADLGGGQPSPWLNAITHGATVLPSDADFTPLHKDPEALVRKVAGDVDACLEQMPDTSLIWAYVNFDEYFHHLAGDDGDARRALRAITAKARRWAAGGHNVFLYSDHGNTVNRSHPAQLEAWMQATDPKLCRHPPGGAGRVRWCYPRPGMIRRVLSMLEDRLHGDAVVCEREEALSPGFLEGEVKYMVGEVICIAQTPAFPIPNPQHHREHGSWSAEEMIVPLAVWLAH